MANLNSVFLKYETKISLPASKQNNIVERHNALRVVIENYFRKKDGFKIPVFYIQGSYKMNLMVQKKDGTYDVDLGVYFKDKPIQTCTTVQGYVLDAVKNHTSGGASHLKKCIRVNYTGDFNIDLPVYFQRDGDPIARLAIKNGDWRIDDPEEMVKWFDKKRKEKEIKYNGQLIRIVKYLKRWANERSFKTPSGLALTVWAANRFVPKENRDDLSLYETIKDIRFWMLFGLSCDCPVEPKDNLLENLDLDQKSKFRSALASFCDDAGLAISLSNEADAIKLWKKHLGDKFSL